MHHYPLLNVLLVLSLMTSHVPWLTFEQPLRPLSASSQITSLPANVVGAPATVNITGTGFVPQTTRIDAGETVVWINQTTHPQQIKGGAPYRVFLPLVVRNSSTNVSHQEIVDTQTAILAQPWESGVIQPGERYTHTFTTAGEYPYYLGGSLTTTGLVEVREPQYPPADFVVGAAPLSQRAIQGQMVDYTVAVTATNGFTLPVTLNVTGLPAGTSATWGTNPLTPDSSTHLTVVTHNNTLLGVYTLTIAGSGGGREHEVQVTLQIDPRPDFTLSVGPLSQEVAQGGSGVYTATITTLHGFSEMVALSVVGLPAGASVAWNQNPIAPGNTAFMTVSVSLASAPRSYELSIKAIGGGIERQTTTTLVVTPHPDFTIDIQPPTRTVTQAHSVTYTVALAPEHGFAAPVALSISGLPAGATASWSANSSVPPASVILTITAGSQTPTGNYTLLVTGTGGGFVHTTSAELSVTLHDGFTLAIDPDTRSVPQGQRAVYTATVTGLYDFTEPVQLTLSGLPAGVTAAIAPNPVTPSGTAAITLTTALTAPLGTHALTLTGTGGGRSHNIPFTLVVTPHPDFTIGIQPPTRTVTQAHSVTYTVALAPEHGFAAPVTLSVSGLPSGATASWSANPNMPPASVILTITAGSQTPSGDHTLTIAGTGGGFVHNTTVGLAVVLHEGFELEVSPEAQSVPQGTQARYTAEVNRLYDFAEPVSLAVAGLPAGVVATIAPNPVTPAAVAAITLTAALTAPVGTHALTLTGTGGGRTHSLPFTLTVTPHPDFTIKVTPNAISVRQSRIITVMVTLDALHGFADPVALSVTGLPADMTAAWATTTVTPTGATVLTLTATPAAPLGLHPLIITGHGDSFTHSTSLDLIILEHPDFAFIIEPPTQVITQGVAVTYTAQLLGQNDWDTPVNLSVQGLPNGTAAAWEPDLAVPDANSTLVVTPGLNTLPGLYILTAIADGELLSHTVPIALEVLAIPEPDLVVESITTYPSIPTAGMPCTLTVQVRNLGGRAVTETFRIDWYLNPASPPLTTTPGIDYWLQPGLAPGASVVFTTVATFPVAGEHLVWAQVDRFEVASESNETNNITGPVTITAGLPDLWLPSLHISPAIPVAGTPATVTISLENKGIVRARGPFRVDWYANLPTAPLSVTTETTTWTRADLPAGVMDTLSTTYTFSDVGIHRLWAQVDRTGQVMESDEDNNITGAELLFVDRPQPTPTPLWTPTPVPTPYPTPSTGPRQNFVTVPTTIGADTTWVSGTVYLIVGRVTLNAGVVLTIEPGAVVKFQQQPASPYYKGRLTINGTLLAQGTATAPIIFTSYHDDAYGGDTNANGGATWPNAGDWDGLEFTTSSTGSVLAHTRITYGGGNGSHILVNGAAMQVRDSVIRYGSGSGLRWSNGASGQIIDNEIANHLSYALYLTGSSSPTVQGNTIAQNRTYAIYMEGNCFPVLEANTVYGNALNGSGVYGSIGTGTWYANTDLPYIATQNLIIESANALTLQSNVVVKFATNTNLIVRGTLVASGTLTQPIVFTSLKDDEYGSDTQQDGGATKPTPGDWGTLYFADTSNDAQTILDHVIVRYGGAAYSYSSGTSYANITLDSASPRILNSFIEHSAKYGVQLVNASSPYLEANTIWDNKDSGLWASAASSPQVVDNAFVRNNGYAVYLSGSSQAVFGGNVAVGNRTNGIGVSGTLNADTTWGANIPYVVDASLTLALNTVLTIQPGTVIKFTSGGNMTVNGQMLAQGTETRRIVFTSLQDDAIGGDTNNDGGATIPARGNWDTLRLASTSSTSVLDYVTVRYGGSASTTGALFFDGSAPMVNHLVVMGSQYRGLYAQGTSLSRSNFSQLQAAEKRVGYP